MSRRFDPNVIGTGPAGPSLAGRFATANMAVAIIDRHKVGGRFVSARCIPTKTLIAYAHPIHAAHRGAECGS